MPSGEILFVVALIAAYSTFMASLIMGRSTNSGTRAYLKGEPAEG